jgi:hypothetical protein
LACRFERGEATVKISGVGRLKFGFINTMLRVYPDAEEATYAAKNFVIQLKEVEFDNFDEGFGGLNKSEKRGMPTKINQIIEEINAKIR